MPSISLPVRTLFTLTWTLTDAQGNAVNNAVVTATLYAGRSTRDPDNVPGTPVPPIDCLDLPFVTTSSGQYSASVPGTLDPPLNGVGYVLVINGKVAGQQVYHAEVPAVVETAGSTVDLTTVDLVKNRAGVTTSTDDAEIQSAITGFSTYLLKRTGQPSLNSVVTLDEFYDGNGNNRLFLRGGPIRLLRFVNVGGRAVPLSTRVNGWGAVIDQSRRSIVLRGGSGNFSSFPYPAYPVIGSRGPVFVRGTQNIEVGYDCGYDDVPVDLEFAVRCVVAINYKRKGWLDLKNRNISTSGTQASTSFQAWEWPPENELVFRLYDRMGIIA